MRHLAGTAAVAVLLVAGRAGAAGIDITWDRDVAFEYDRDAYQRRLHEIVTESYAFVSAETGLSLRRSLTVRVLATAHYEAKLGHERAMTTGGCYRRGVIYVNGGSRQDDRFVGTIVHEMTHALLDHAGTGQRLPLWMDEGLAERLAFKRRGQDDLAPNQKAVLQYEGREGRLTPLPAFGRLKWTYLQVQAAALFFEQKAGKDRMYAVIRRTLDGDTFERALDAELRWTLTDLDRQFLAWIEHLP